MTYEDLVAAPEVHFTRAVKFLGIPANATQIARAIRFSSFERLQKQESEQGFIERPEQSDAFFRGGKSGAWRDVLTPEQVSRIVSAHREQMVRFGYIPEGY